MSPLAGIAALLLVARPAALQGTLSAEAGLEYDSNANRAETGGPDRMEQQASPLLRMMASGLFLQQGGRHRLRLQLAAGGKVFFLPAVQDQDIGVVQLAYEEGAQMGRMRISGLLDYYDAYQAVNSREFPSRSRDFRAADTGLRLQGQGPLSGQHSVEGGIDLLGQYFGYKPNDGYTFLAPSMLGRLLFRLHTGDPELGHDFELGLSGRFDYRGYFDRSDDFLQLGFTAAWVGPVLLQLGYTFELNRSTDSQESYQRHVVLAKVAARIPGDLYLTVKGQLNLLNNPDLQLIPTASIDEENRSLLAVDLERPLSKGFALSARYTGYFELGSLYSKNIPPYQRHTVYLGVSYKLKLKRGRY